MPDLGTPIGISFSEDQMTGRVWKFGHDVNTDEIIPGRYDITIDESYLAKHCFYEIRPDFSSTVQPGDFIVAGENFGSGSSREQASLAIKASGIQVIIAESFARIFYRNAVNIGLPVFVSKRITDRINEGDNLKIELDKSVIINVKTNEALPFVPMAPFLFKILKTGGIIPFLLTRKDKEFWGVGG